MEDRALRRGFRYECRVIFLAGLSMPLLLLAAVAAGAAEGPARVGFVASAALLVGASGWLFRGTVRRIAEIAAVVTEGADPCPPTRAGGESLEAVLDGVRELRGMIEEQGREILGQTAQLARLEEELRETRERLLGMAGDVERQIMGTLFRDHELS